jgi:predicted N-acetyltransferase YhbS
MIEIAHERHEDAAAIETILDDVFGSERQQKISYRYRTGIAPIDDLRWVARRDGRLVGTLRFWPVRIGPRWPALLLGPIAVEPMEQRQGLGVRLMKLGLATSQATGHRIVLLVGPLDYYRRFGFEASAPHGIVMPDESPERLQVLALVPGALDGVAGELRRADGSMAGRENAPASSTARSATGR